METIDVKNTFNGFGPITQSKTTHMGGFGREGSFSPAIRNRVSVGNAPTPITENPRFPFAVWRQYSNEELKYGVYYFSELRLNAIDSSIAAATIDGLLGDNPLAQDVGWFTATEEDRIYLECEFDNNVFQTASIKHGSDYVGGIGVTGGDIQFNTDAPPKQIFARKLIATVNEDGTVDQQIYTHLSLNDFCVNGVSVKHFITI